MNIFLGILLVLSSAAIGYLIWSSKSGSSESTDAKNEVKEFFKMALEQQTEMRRQLDDRLKEVSKVMGESGRNIGERLDTAAKVVNTVNQRLSQLEESNKRIHDIGKDISSLQEILRAPKLRGSLGELFLENLLAQILPRRDLYALQHTFKSGEKVDAVIFLRDSLMVCVDAKFPLENFKKMIETQGDEEADAKKVIALKKLFITDVKKHVDAIASKYILPTENTLDFALMYIPAENVYYETITRELDQESHISQYALSKKVIPVSPNTFYIYLQTLLIGLRGMQVEKSAQDILKQLSQLKGDFKRFSESYSLVGSHLGHTVGSFQKSEKQLEKMQGKLLHIENPGEKEEVVLLEP
ncbi:MAG: DNA recombination protein RmuC [Patescibacteria group bacterium]